MTRAYGPHRPEDAPTTVVALGARQWPVEELRARPAGLIRQRKTLNDRAYDRGRA
jgi:hypothetical protein